MFREIIDSIKSNVSNKLRNPFLGTLTIIYILKNWELFYTILTLDNSLSIENRVKIIQPLFNSACGIANLLTVLLITFLTFIMSYLLLSISRFIILLFTKKVNPRIDKITDDKSIVSKKIYDELNIQNSSLREKYESEHQKLVKLQEERDVLQEKILNLSAPKEKKVKIESENTRTKPNEVFVKLYDQIYENDWNNNFDKLITDIRNDKRFPTDNELITELLKYSIIQKNKKFLSRETGTIYEFTSIGNEFVQYYILRK